MVHAHDQLTYFEPTLPDHMRHQCVRHVFPLKLGSVPLERVSEEIKVAHLQDEENGKLLIGCSLRPVLFQELPLQERCQHRQYQILSTVPTPDHTGDRSLLHQTVEVQRG